MFPDIGHAAPDDDGRRARHNKLMVGVIGFAAMTVVVASGWWLLVSGGGNVGPAGRPPRPTLARQTVEVTPSATPAYYDETVWTRDHP